MVPRLVQASIRSAFYQKVEGKIYVLKERGLKALLGSQFRMPLPIELNSFNSVYLNHARSLKGFDYRNIRSLVKELETMGCPREVIFPIKLSWSKLKIIITLRPELTSMVRFLWKLCLDLDGQEEYDSKIQRFSECSDNEILGFRSGKIPGKLSLLDRHLLFLEREWWIPLSAFPLLKCEKESKMQYCYYEADLPVLEFEDLLATYLKKISPKRIFPPSPESCRKIGNNRFNDRGVIKRDCEKVTSFSCSFKYQKFITKPLTPREVWVPDFSTKINNTWWSRVGLQLLDCEPAYPSPDPDVNWDRIKDFISHVFYFDITAFGLQYPREYLISTMKYITLMFPSDIVEEQFAISTALFDKLKVEMEDGTYEYPPRGTGLGYYESLKTIGILSILDKYHPLSLYGDQGIFQNKGTIREDVLRDLRHFGFFIKDEKTSINIEAIKWSGDTMSSSSRREPMSVWTVFLGDLFLETHWERKNAYHSSESLDFFSKSDLDKFVPFHYELIFGYEFYRSDSYNHYTNTGLRLTGSPESGMIRTWKLQKLRDPSWRCESYFLYSQPFVQDYSPVDKHKFSKFRKNLWKKSKPFDTVLIDYVNPIIEYNKKKNPYLTSRCLPLWADMRSLVFDNVTSGAIASGLPKDLILDSYFNQRFAPDPYKARARGGYSFNTLYRSSRGPDLEMLLLTDILLNADDLESNHIKRYDVPKGIEDAFQERNLAVGYLLKKGFLEKTQETLDIEGIFNLQLLPQEYLEEVSSEVSDSSEPHYSDFLHDLLQKTVPDILYEELWDPSSKASESSESIIDDPYISYTQEFDSNYQIYDGLSV